MASAVASTALKVAKEAVRSEIIKKIASVSRSEISRQSNQVIDKLIRNGRYVSSHRISVFLSMECEVETQRVLENVFKTGKTCFVPRYDPNSQHMDMVGLLSMEDYNSLPLTSWKVKQPREDEAREEALASGGLDLMLVPGLAFTKTGKRIGRGKGYYDIYMDKCLHDPHGRPYTIGLCFNEQILHNIPTDEHDFVVDEVIFPDLDH